MAPLDVKTSFGTQANVVTIWKWNASNSTWAFYAPALDTNATLASYAASKGYNVLATIDPGEGYVWALDTTYIPMKHGFVYLTAVVDVASRRVLAHKVATTLDVILAVDNA